MSLKTAFEKLNLVESYDTTSPNVFIFSILENAGGPNFFGQYILSSTE